MDPINFEGVNLLLTKPGSMTDDECHSLPAYKGTDESGFPFFMVAFKPSESDLEAIREGRPIFLKVIGNEFPPLLPFTTDQNGNMNF